MSALRQLVSRVVPGRTTALAVEPDAFFRTVSSPRRRFIIDRLADDGTPVGMPELADELAVHESDTADSPAGLTDRESKRCYVSLYQNNLGVLADAGIIRWDREDSRIHTTPTTHVAASILNEMRAAIPDSGLVYDRAAGRHRGLSSDDVFDLLSNARRRHVVSLLSDVEPGGQATLDWLANKIAEIETGKHADMVTSTERKRVYVGLYQCHLPKLHDLGFVNWDDTDPIVPTDRIGSLFDVLLIGDRRLGL